MSYATPYVLTEKRGNNVFCYDMRKNKSLIIPALIEGTLDDISVGDTIAFEEEKHGELISCQGLRNFIRLTSTLPIFATPEPLITIFDNHNHALYFWLEAVEKGVLKAGFELIHIDEHSDLWENPHTLHLEKAIQEEAYRWDFTNLSCHVGNYIAPALQSGLIQKIVRIENEYQLDQHMDYIPGKESVLNLDLDFFAPEMDFISERKKITCIRNLLPHVKCITIATSPYFIDQGRALEKLKRILISE